MSQSLATLALGTQQLPRIFHRARNSSPPLQILHREYETLLTTENVLAATVKGTDELQLDDLADHEIFEQAGSLSPRASFRSHNDKVFQQQINSFGFRTVEDIEKWLKNINEPISSTKFAKRSNLRIGTDRYLSEQLPELFFDKDFITTESNVVNKNLNINFDAIFNELQNEKILSACKKDDAYVLPDLQLDNLDQLGYCTDDIIISNDILPTPSNQPPCTNINANTKDLIIRLQGTINRISDSNIIVQNIQTQNVTEDLNDNQLDNDIIDDCRENDFCSSSLMTTMKNLSTKNVSYSESDMDDPSYSTDLENDLYTIESHSLTLQPSNLSETTKLHIKFKKVNSSNKNSVNIQPKLQLNTGKRKSKMVDKKHGYSKKKSLTIHNSSTDQQSDLTNNFTNSKENGQSSTRRSSRLKSRLRKQSSTSDSYESEQEDNLRDKTSSYYSHHELIITNALKKVGITDNKLQFFTTQDKIKMWRCHLDDCGREFNKLWWLKIHLLTHFGIKPYKCDYDGCSWAFSTDANLKRHKKTHLKKKDYMCSIPNCKRRFTTVYNLAFHEKSHEQPNRVICHVPECSAKFKNKRDLATHMKSHNEILPPYLCSYEGCDKRFYSSNALMSHQRCHNHSDSEITCSWPGCGKIFDHPSQTKTHMRSHTGYKPYICTFKGCKWAFSTASKLKRHQMKHTNDRKFVCDIGDCRKSYMRLEHLKDHKLSHSQEKYFHCHYCETAFSLKCSLRAHIKRHMNQEFVKTQIKKNKTVEKKKINKKVALIDNCLSNNQNITNRKSGARNIAPSRNSLCPSTTDKEDTEKRYYCPMDLCTKWYLTKSSLRMHLEKKHMMPLSEIQNNDMAHVTSDSLFSHENLAVHDTPEYPTDKSTEQIDLPSFAAASINDQGSPIQTNPDLQMNSSIDGNKGSARTAFTGHDVRNLKFDSEIVDPSNVDLITTDLGASLLPLDDLPSMCCQHDLEVPGYQILLDTVSTDSDISMRMPDW